MAYSPSNPRSPDSSEEPDTDFNWPPTEAELEQYRLVPPEAVAQPPAPAIAEAATPSSSEPRYAEWDCHQGDEGSMPSGADDRKHTGTDDPTRSRVEAGQNETALEPASQGAWAMEIARLQELIEGLTQRVEWRVTDATGH